jgi:YegS/Rv2252/BmrU family lipid kinase
VVVNPSKVEDLAELRRSLDTALRLAGAGPARWLETTEEDAGSGQSAQLVREGVDLVLCHGGDGTVRACAESLRGSDVPLAVLPAGTGNLLARNLQIPMALEDAVAVAVRGERRRIDVGTANGDTFAVMAGLGIDAAMVRDAPEAIKGRIGWLAYGISGLQAVRKAPVLRIELELDDGRVIRTRGVGVVVANVGTLTGGMTLFPDADPFDGLLDIGVLLPTTWRDWAELAMHVVARPEGRRPHLRTWSSHTVTVTVDREVATEVDGEVRATTRRLDLQVMAESLLVCVPGAGTT